MRKNKNQYNEYDNLLEGGEEGDAKEPSKKESSKKPSSKKKEEPPKQEEEDDDPYSPPVKEECCCCLCVCATENTKDTTCCGCMPVKCGVVIIGVFTLIVTVILFLWNYWLFLNEYLHWWYTMVCLFILCPLLVGANFVVSWFIKDTRTTRVLLWTSQLLALITVVLLCIWQLAYFIGIYKKGDFYQGQGDIATNEYTVVSKKAYIVVMLAETIILAAFFGYFMAVTSSYCEACHGPEEDKAEEKPEEEAAGDDDNKDDKPEGGDN